MMIGNPASLVVRLLLAALLMAAAAFSAPDFASDTHGAAPIGVAMSHPDHDCSEADPPRPDHTCAHACAQACGGLAALASPALSVTGGALPAAWGETHAMLLDGVMTLPATPPPRA
jgi:hypothetical protein